MAYRLQDVKPVSREIWHVYHPRLTKYATKRNSILLCAKTIPISTAYIAWTGLGAIGTFIIGLCFFGDTLSITRMFFALLIIIGIVGLEVVSK